MISCYDDFVLNYISNMVKNVKLQIKLLIFDYGDSISIIGFVVSSMLEFYTNVIRSEVAMLTLLFYI